VVNAKDQALALVDCEDAEDSDKTGGIKAKPAARKGASASASKPLLMPQFVSSPRGTGHEAALPPLVLAGAPSLPLGAAQQAQRVTRPHLKWVTEYGMWVRPLPLETPKEQHHQSVRRLSSSGRQVQPLTKRRRSVGVSKVQPGTHMMGDANLWQGLVGLQRAVSIRGAHFRRMPSAKRAQLLSPSSGAKVRPDQKMQLPLGDVKVQPGTHTMGEKVWVRLARPMGADRMLEMGQRNIRVVEWQNIDIKLFTSSPRDLSPAEKQRRQAETYALGRPAKSTSEMIDFFVSHSWHDDGEAKFNALTRVAQNFRRKHHRYPTFWLDAVCFDQANLSNSLKVLPVNIQRCRQLLVLGGTTYPERLWCVWELYTLFAFSTKEVAQRRVLVESLEGDAGCDVVERLLHFELANSHCYDPNEENKIRGVIAQSGAHQFERLVREVGDACSRRSKAKSKMLG